MVKKMTFTTRLKEEISKDINNEIENRWIIDAFLKYNSLINNKITLTLENASVTRFIYKIIKEIYGVQPNRSSSKKISG